MADGKVVIETDLDSTGIESGLSQLKGVVAKGAAALGIGKIFKDAIDNGSDFEAKMSEVQAISGATSKDLAALTDKAKEMGAATKFSATESAEALKYMSMAGWDTEQMVSGLPGIMNLAAASGENLGTVSDIVTDAMTAFGLQASDSAHFADVLAKASSSSNTNVGLMGETFKYVAPIAGSMKYSIEDTATAIGLMANAGIKGGEAGTALRSILTRLVKPPKEAAEALDELGISAQNSDGTVKPLREVIGDLREKFAGLDDSQKAQYAASIAGQEAMSGLLAVVGASDSDFNKLTKAINNADGAAEKQANTMNNNLKGALYELSSAAEAVGIELYDDIKEPLQKATKKGAGYVRGLASAIKQDGIESLIPDEAITGIKNLGSTAKTVGGGSIKVLSKGVKGLADNLDVVVPLTTAYFGAMAGYKVFGLASAGVKTLTGAYKVLQAAEAANAITLNATYGGFTLLQTAVGIFTGKISLATAATGAFNTVCTALGGPIGVALAAVGALVAGVGAYALITSKSSSEEDKFAEKIKKSEEAYKEYQSTIKENKKAREEAISTARNEGAQADKLSEKLNSLMSVENKSAGQKEQIKTIVEKLNELLPDLGLAYDEEEDKLNKSTDAIQKNIAAQKELAMAKAYGAQMESVTGDIIETETKLAKATEQRAEAEKKLEAAQKKVDEARELGIAPKDNAALQIALEEQRQMNEAYESADGQVQKYQKSLTNLNTELDTLSNRQIGETNYAAYLQDLDKLCEEAKIKAKEIPDSVAQGMKEGVYANPTTGEELKALLNLDGLVQQALSEGKEVTVAVAQGIQSGQYVLPESTAALQNLVTFDGMIQEAGLQGEKVPIELANKIASGKLTVEEAVQQLGISDAMDKAAQETEKSKKKIEQNTKVKPVDNSAAAKKSESTFTNNYGKGAEKVKKSSNKTSKAAKIKAPDNTSEANKAVQDYAGATEKGSGEVKAAAEKVSKEGASGFGTETGEAKSAGEKLGTAFASGISSKAGTAKKAGKKVASSAKSGANAEKAGFKSVGSNLAAGIASGIIANSPAVSAAARSAVKKAKDAAISEADINSPSKVFEKEVGKFLPLGMAVGIRKNTGELEDASREMASASLEATADELEIHSPSKKYKDAIGVNIPRGIASGVNVAKAELLGEMKTTMTEVLAVAKGLVREGEYSKVGSSIVSGLSESLSLAKTRSSNSIQSVIDAQYDAVAAAHEKAESALQDKINKTKSKKKKKSLKKRLSSLKAANKAEEEQLKEAGEKVANAFNTAFEKEAERLTEIAQKQIQELSEKYQKEYDNIISLRDGLISKQQSWGNVYDLEQNIFDIERYQEKLKALENNIPESMMEKILGMNVDEATAYMDWFQSMTQEQQKAYIENWNKQQSMAENFSKSFFADDISKLESEYQTKLKKATDKLQMEMNQIGVNIAKGLTAGIQSETRTASTAMKNLCNTLIATAKKQLGIKSPSKKFTELGVYDIQGLEKGHEKEAKNLYKQMGTVSKTMAQRFAEANLDLPDLRGKMEAAVLKQMGRITANVRLPEIQQNISSGSNSEQPVFVGPEKIEVVLPLEGREVARVTVPFMDQFLNAIIERKLRGGV